MRLGDLKVWVLLTLLSAQLFLWPELSRAVPSYARQTNLPCTACHVVFPELASFGRLFKLHGYTMVGADVITAQTASGKNTLNLLKTPPLSGMLQASYNRVQKAQPGTQNDDVGFPEQLSFFFAGQVTPHLGAFVQFTYAIEGASFGWDLVDIRYSNQTSLSSKDLIYGTTLNNNPTIQDVWNSTPVWGFPYSVSSSAPSPTAAALVDGGLERQVAGFGAYGFWNNMIYGEFDLYRSAPQGGPHPPDTTSTGIIKGVAPYWRLALQHQWPGQYLEIGTYGLSSRIFPAGVSGVTDRFTDLAFDLQLERPVDGGYVTAHATWIHERQRLDATYGAGGAVKKSHSLNTLRINANFYVKQRFGVLLGYFSTTGKKDTLVNSPAPVVGSRIGKPDSDGIIAELDVLPWLNTKFSLQYVIYNKFNGARKDYDGFGRHASDNNTIFFLSWFAM